MSELQRYLVLFVAFVAFLLAGYIQGGGTWRGHHNLRKSLPAKGATIGMQGDRYGCDGCYDSVRSLRGTTGSRNRFMVNSIF
jgi:hypothetical protein